MRIQYMSHTLCKDHCCTVSNGRAYHSLPYVLVIIIVFNPVRITCLDTACMMYSSDTVLAINIEGAEL